MTFRTGLLLAFAGGVVAPWLLAPMSSLVSVAPTQAASEGLAQCLVLTGFLFVPASIFAPVVGAMFPSYWNATPVTIIRSRPFEILLGILAVCVAYGVSAIGSSLVWPVTWWVLAPMLVAVGLGGLAAIWLVWYSLAIFDAERLAMAIRDTAPKRADKETAERAANDLCRLVRGLRERERPTAAAKAIDQLRLVWERHGAKLTGTRGLTDRVLNECIKDYGKRAEVRQAVEECRGALP